MSKINHTKVEVELENKLSERASEINLLGCINAVRQEMKNLGSSTLFTDSDSQWSKVIRERLNSEMHKLNRTFLNYFPEAYTIGNKKRKLNVQNSKMDCKCHDLSQQVCNQQVQIEELESKVRKLRTDVVAKEKIHKLEKVKTLHMRNENRRLKANVVNYSQVLNTERQNFHEFRLQSENNVKVLKEKQQQLTEQIKKQCKDIFNLNAVISRNEMEKNSYLRKIRLLSERVKKMERRSQYKSQIAFQYPNLNPNYDSSQKQHGAEVPQKCHLIDQAKVEFRAKNYAKAVEILEKALQLDFNVLRDAHLLYNRGIAFAYLGNYDECINDCNSLVSPVYVSCYLLQAYCKIQKLETDKAIQYFRRLGELNCEDLEYYLKKSQMLKELEDKIQDYEECYRLLGVQENSSEGEIKKAYKDLALIHHPDKNLTSGKEAQQQHAEMFKSIKNAADKVLDPQSKISYRTNIEKLKKERASFAKLLLSKCHAENKLI